MHAYSELYVEKAQIALGCMLQYAVYDLGEDLQAFYRQFLNSGNAYRFGKGEPKYTVGMSGIELAREVIYRITGEYIETDPSCIFDKTPEYWTGWAVVYYEWFSTIPFERIEQCVPVTEIRDMYHTYHEMDITRYIYEMDVRIEDRISALNCRMEDLISGDPE